MRRLGTLALFALLASCGIEKVPAVRQHLRALPLRNFPKQNWRLPNNKFFLWRENLTPEQVSRAQAIGLDIDALDSQAMPLNRRQLELTELAEPIKEDVRRLSNDLRPIKADYDNGSRRRIAAIKERDKANADLTAEKAKPNPDAAVIAKLEEKIAALVNEIDKLDKTLVALKPRKEKLEAQIAAKRAELVPIQDELDALEIKQLEIQNQGQQKVEEIMTIVDWYKDQPLSVVFQFESNGSLQGSISGWNLGDDAGARDFSSRAAPGRKPTMGKITYTERGGVFTFEAYVFRDTAQTELRETYLFKVSRAKYDSPDGRIFFTGEITRQSVEGGKTVTRRGIAKMVDRNN